MIQSIHDYGSTVARNVVKDSTILLQQKFWHCFFRNDVQEVYPVSKLFVSDTGRYFLMKLTSYSVLICVKENKYIFLR